MDTSMYTPVDFDPVTPPLTSRPSKRCCTLAHFGHDGPLSPSDVRLLDVSITCSYDQSSLPFVQPHISVLRTNSAALGHLVAADGSCYVSVPVLQSTEFSFGCSSQSGPKCLCLPEPSGQTPSSLLVESPSPHLAPCVLSQCCALDDSSLYDVTVTLPSDSAVFASTRGDQIDRSVFADGFSVSSPQPDAVVGVAVGTMLPSMSGTPLLIGLNNQTYNQIGPLLPLDGQRPQFAQLYIYDCANEAANRVSAVTGRGTADEINQSIVEGLIAMFDSCNAVVKLFRTAKDRIDADGSKAIRIRLIRSRGSDPRTYSLPTSTQIGGLIVGDTRFCSHIKYVDSPVKQRTVRKTMNMREYYAYQLQQRNREGEILLRGGRLFQQNCVDAYSSVQEGELLWLNNHQIEIFADMYTNVRDAVH
ncbi:hypothetical protein COLO4_36124 [Corchorus olitorius]|uniref:Uncharacterized protein n=1 Tax=Corchorus olitorius TaxID=93759 RepID=A0A1R3GAU8_9ROSI|nr:hypothetical protein COLO4_36124 [Corchorus olitorius]